VRVHPAPLYEVILYVSIFAFLWSRRKQIAFEGQYLCLYLILGGAARFLVEFIRINERVAFGLSEAQVISLVMIAIGIVAWPLLSRRTQPVAAAAPAQA